MIKKALRWLLRFVLVVFLLALLAGAGLFFYVQHNQHRAVKEVAAQLGLDISYASAKPTLWATFPQFSLRVDSLTVRDLDNVPAREPLLTVRTLEAAFNLRKIWRDTLVWESFRVADGSLHIVGDSTGNYNLGKLTGLGKKDERGETKDTYGLLRPYLDLNGIEMDLDNLDLSYRDPRKHKLMALRIDSVRTSADTLSNRQIRLETCLSTDVKGLSFNTLKGSYLKNHHLAGCFSLTKKNALWVVDTTTITAGTDAYRLAGDIGPAGLHLRIANPRLDYDRARLLLHDTLQARLSNYHVEGPFAVVADVYKKPDGGNDVDLELQFTTSDQKVRLQQFVFTGVSTSGTFYSRLPPSLGGTPGATTEFLIETGPTLANYDGMRIRSPGARVRGFPSDAFLHSPIDLSGPAGALARLFGNTEFLFTKGQFSMLTEVNASLGKVEEIINTSDGQLSLMDLGVKYVPSAVTLPVEQLSLSKRGKDVEFSLNSGHQAGGVDFTLVGYLSNILPLLLERPADSLQTEVIFHARRGDWAGFRKLFSAAEYAGAPRKEAEPIEVQAQRMKQTLLGIGNKFSPHLQMVIDTMAYYDVLTLLDFRAGMKFRGDTLVLEKSRLDLPQGTLQLSADVNLGEYRSTPFRVAVSAAALNLDALRKPLRAFGLKLPAGIRQLPTGLDIEFDHTGVINDSFGIQPGLNVGKLDFVDGHRNLFSGSIAYRPGADGLLSNLQLRGDPAFVNDIFAATDFFFGTGHFSLDLQTRGVPGDLEALLRQSDLRLSLDSSRVTYAPAGVFVPINKMEVNAVGDKTSFDLTLLADTTRRAARLTGEMDRLSAFLFPEAGKPFQLRADFSASRFHVEDIFDLVQLEDTTGRANTSTADSSAFDPQLLLSTTEGIFQAFRPTLSLRIDTFRVAPATQFTELSARVRLLDSTLLMVDKTGFSLGDGTMDLSATYAIDQHDTSPFTFQWDADSLSVADLERTLSVVGVLEGGGEQLVKGVLSSTGDVRGVLNETRWELPINRTSGTMTLRLEKGALRNHPLLQKMGRKLLMKKRFRDVLLGPLELTASIDSGRLSLPVVEVQSTALQLFVEGYLDTVRGPDLLVSIPLRNIGRGKLEEVPPPTGYALAGRKVYLVVEPDEAGETQMNFRLGRRKYYRDRGLLDTLRKRKEREKATRREFRKKRRQRRRDN